jgi:hypothetical protein
MPAIGNHDINLGNDIWYVGNFDLPTNGPASYREKNYSYDYGNAHFAVIDSNPFADGDTPAMAAIKTWLSNDLAAATRPWKFVYCHHPPYTSHGSHPDTTAVQEELSPLFESSGVHVVFQGHNHHYERINAINGVYYVTVGGSGQSLHGLTLQKDYSALVYEDLYSFAVVDIDGMRLDLRAINENGSVIDAFHLDIGHPFDIDGLVDSAAWGRATNGLVLYAAIRGNYLYVATQDAGEGGDHFIYMNNQLTTSRPANWAKSGQVMQWGAFLADENDGGYNNWFGPDDQPLAASTNYRSMTSGLNNNSNWNNGVLEGTLNLASYFGSFPSNLYLAAAPFGTVDGSTNYAPSQVPAGNGNGNIEPGEFLALSSRSIALDLPDAEAGPGATNEAGMSVPVNGTGSAAPSGLPLSYQWSGASFGSITSATTSAWITNNVATSIVAQLTVHDTRFDSNDTVALVFYPMADSDGDGLSDREEATGSNNVLTAANPGGKTSATNNADTDADGFSDGNEALAGTDPGDGYSLLELAQPLRQGGELVIYWSSVTGRQYAVYFATNLPGAINFVTSNLAATPPVNAFTVTAVGVDQRFYFIQAGP